MGKGQLSLLDHELAVAYVEFKSFNPDGSEEEFARSREMPLRTWYDKKSKPKFSKILEQVEGEVIARIQVAGVERSIKNKETRLALRQELVNNLMDTVREKPSQTKEVASTVDSLLKSAAIETGEWNEKVKTEGLVTVHIGSDIAPVEGAGGE